VQSCLQVVDTALVVIDALSSVQVMT